MGGVRNREEKLKKNKVFTSGAGGGSKGPSVIDKRGQELECPHCDRIFKQSGRLNDHIKKQHSDLAVPDASNEGQGAGPSSSSSSLNSAAVPKPAAAAAAAPPQNSKPAPRVMDVGSKGGAFDYKSPKLMLQELLLRDKAPKPRYKTLPSADGTKWRCKVVLPHPKQSDKDVVLFLDDGHAAASEEEAQQCGAVVALHHLAGDRALERTLPPQYVPLWKALGVTAHEKKMRAANQAERRATQQAKQQAALKRRGPSTVVMTEDNRRMVEGIIAEIRGEGSSSFEGGIQGDVNDGWENFGRPEATSSEVNTIETAPALIDDLVVLGFSEEDAARAVRAVSSSMNTSGGNGQSGAQLSDALDWLCLNAPEERLPSNFAPGAAGKPLTILHRSTGGRAHSASNASLDTAEGGDMAVDEDPAVRELMQFGYPPFVCAEALSSSGGHVHDALRALWTRISSSSGTSTAETEDEKKEADEGGQAAAAADGGELSLGEWLEEREALEAIYASDVTFHSDFWTSLSLTVVLEDTVAEEVARHSNTCVSKEELMVDGLPLVLEAWAPTLLSRGSSMPYPQTVPALAVRSPLLPARVLLALTQSLSCVAQGLRGHPMMYELAIHAAEALPDCVLRPPSLETLLGVGKEPEEEIVDQDVEKLASEVEDGLRLGGRGSRGRKHGTGNSRRPQKGGHSSLNIAAESSRLLQRHKELEVSPKHAPMRSTRAKLPAFAKRDEVVSAVSASRVVVVSGATGCGKSTQVPQYILEEAITGGSGASCNIICTQPRRISAIGLASRVAAERGESVGETIGYSVRLDSKQTARTRLLFCTTGILLRRLLSDNSLSGTTHVVLDEVHERSIESDLLLMLLRQLLLSGANPHLRVVLMSATADANLFASYFETSLKKPSAVLSIPGFTHPVTDLFLEDALEATGMVIGKSSKWAKKSATSGGGNSNSNSSGAHSNGGASKNSKGKKMDASRKDCAEDNLLEGRYSPQTIDSLHNVDESQLNYDLVEALVAHVADKQRREERKSELAHPRDPEGGAKKRSSSSSANAILVFAPGAEEISRIVRAIQNSGRVAAASPGGVRALPLHGGLPPSHQARVFERPPPGVLKVVVATNVAETSITIDDVVCVIDAGRVKEMRFDPERGIARLQETWVSQASAQQRRGRAGRVRPGTCYRLYSRQTWGRMAVDTPPEISRAPLQSLVMDVKGILRDADAEAVLSQMITAPKAAAVAQAVLSLQRVGALDTTTGALTPLGQHLTRMPCDPRVGKMLIFGAMLRCLDPVLTVAALQGHGRPAFFCPPDRREEANAARAKLTVAVATSKSDHLAAVAAFNGWRAALCKGGRGAASDFCSKYFISDQAMDAIHSGRRQYAEILADLGFVPADYPSASTTPSYSPGSASPGTAGGSTGPSGGAERFCGPAGVDQFAGHARVVKAAFAAGLYPQLLRVEHPAAKYQKVQGGAIEAEGEAGKVKFYDRERGRVFLHPSSVNFACGKFESGWLVYSDIVQTSKVFVREASMVPVYAVLLFGGEVGVHHEAGLVRVDEWATFKAPARIAVLVRELRSEVAALLGRKVTDPEVDIGASRVVEAMHHLLSTDGF